MHPLDNVIWQALTTRDAAFAESFGNARRFPQQVTGLGALEEYSDEGYAALARLMQSDGAVGIFLDEPYQARTGWEFLAGAPLLQMIHENGTALRPGTRELCVLGTPDSPEMQELTALTKPGPFGNRTHELGTYLGIRSEGKLVAMAGERLKVPGHTEISAVCTHPDHLGKGYAGALMTELIGHIRGRDETPFLHSRGDNVRAIELYKRLGFRERKHGHYAVIRRG
jgi:ribosomal protein S18 acetylase RimI-like enzyme